MNNPQITPPATQICKSCGQELPITAFARAGYGLHKTCRECEKKSRKQRKSDHAEIEELRRQLEEARRLRLRDFTPRELMLELKERGYDGDLTYTETHTIRLAKLT